MFRFFRRRSSKAAAGFAPVPPPSARAWDDPRPEWPVFVIGDLHGRLDLFEAMLARISERCADEGMEEARIVMVGDFVDRGPDSAGVLRRARALTRDPAARADALLGNHEVMMLEFLDDPGGQGLRWMRFGGRETLESFGVEPPRDDDDVDALLEASDALGEALGDLQGWIRSLPKSWRSGDLLVVHAAADPSREPDDQPERTLLWGSDEFMSEEREDGIWVAHGHTVVESAYAIGGRIATDTGAVYGRSLTAALAAPGRAVEFLTVT